MINANSWLGFFEIEKEKPYFEDLMKTIDQEYENYSCFPAKDLIFNAFNFCDFTKFEGGYYWSGSLSWGWGS